MISYLTKEEFAPFPQIETSEINYFVSSPFCSILQFPFVKNAPNYKLEQNLSRPMDLVP